MSISPEALMRESVVGTRRASVVTELASFICIGGLAALSYVGGSTLMIGLGTGIPDWLMSVLCYAAFIGPAYLAHRRFSFRSEAPHIHALPRYIAVQACGLVLASLFSYVCYGVFGIPAVTSAILVIALTSGFNFVIVRMWAFAGGR